MTGAVEVATNTINAISKNPVLLFLMVFNLIVLGFVLWTVSSNNEMLLAICKPGGAT
jgi:hypothetical protein